MCAFFKSDKFIACNCSISKKKLVLHRIIVYLVTASIFLTILSQLPFLSTRGITQVFQFLWLIILVPIAIFSYKQFLKSLAYTFIFLVPFLLYLLISLIFKLPSFLYQGTTTILLSSFIMIIGLSIGQYVNRCQLKLYFTSYIAASIIYASVLYFSKLRGVDISGSIYAVGAKNSAGPIFIIAALLSFYVFEKKTIIFIILKLAIFGFFVAIIALMKCRTILIALPALIVCILYFKIKNKLVKTIIYISLATLIILIVAIPPLNKIIIQDIFLNGKTELDDIFSGRPSQIINAFGNFKPIFGSGGTYVDCMPVQQLLSYGIVGFASLIPFIVLPFWVLIGFNKQERNAEKQALNIYLLIVFVFEIIFEGYGHFGPGAKSFLLWLIVGFEFRTSFFTFLSKPFILIRKKVSRTSQFAFSSLLASVFILLTVLSFPTKLFSSRISEAIFDKIPTSTEVTEYYAAKDVKISSSKPTTICVGQRIKIDFETSSTKYDEVIGGILDYNERQTEFIAVDSNNSIVTAIKPGWCCFGYTILRNTNIYPSYFTVTNSNVYEFNRIYISTSKFSKTFEYNEDENLILGVGSFSNIYYDEFYVPLGMNTEFVSSNENVVAVDNENRKLKGVGVGSCIITLRLHNDAGDFVSLNHINVSVVGEESFTKCETMDVDISDNQYMYEPLKPVIIFNKNATDKRYDLEILDSTAKYEIHDNSLVFLDNGSATIRIRSVSNPDLVCEKPINILANKPVSFICSNSLLQVGKEYSPHKLGLFLKFTSGHKILVSDKVLEFDPLDFRGRAWFETNGLINDRCTIKTVKTGDAHISLKCKYDKNISDTFYFKVIKFSINEYKTTIASINVLLICFLSVLSIMLVTLIKFKKRIFKTIFYCLLSVAFALLIILVFRGVTITFVAAGVILGVGLVFIFLNQLFFKNDWPNLFCDKTCSDELDAFIEDSLTVINI